MMHNLSLIIDFNVHQYRLWMFSLIIYSLSHYVSSSDHSLPSCLKHLFADDILLYIDDCPVSISSSMNQNLEMTLYL